MGAIISRLKAVVSHGRKKRRIAVGSVEPTSRFSECLEIASLEADVLLVGREAPPLACRIAGSPAEAAHLLFTLLLEGDVDGIVRGQIDYTTFHDAMNATLDTQAGPHGHRDLMCPYLMEDSQGRDWFMTPVVPHDDSTVEGRYYLASAAAKILRQLGIDARVGVLAGDNADEPHYSDVVTRSVRDAVSLVTLLQESGIDALALGLRIDTAAAECNVLVPPDGIVGNFVYRSLGYIAGFGLVGGFTLSPRITSLDTSRYNDDFGLAVIAAAAITELGGLDVVEYADWENPIVPGYHPR